MSFSLALSAALLILGVARFSDAENCLPKFKNIESLQVVGKTCEKNLVARGINLTSLPKPEDWEKSHWDDKCMSNCTFGELKIIVDKEFKKEALVKLLNENAPKEALSKLLKIVDECEAIAFHHEHDHKQGEKKEKQGKDGERAMKPTGMPKEDKSGKKVKTQDMKDNKKGHEHSKDMTPRICRHAAQFMHCFSQKGSTVC